MRVGVLLVVGFLDLGAGVGAAQAQSQSAPAQSGDDFICTSPTERREIRVIPGCRVQYIKNHTASTLWTSHDFAYCAAKAAGLVTTLVKANFSCKTETTAGAQAGPGSPSED